MELKVGEIYTNKSGKTREITKINGNRIYYQTEDGYNKCCWMNDFEEWFNKKDIIECGCEYCCTEVDSEKLIDMDYDSFCQINSFGKLVMMCESTLDSIKINYCPICGRKLD